jgi:hypothetical protein
MIDTEEYVDDAVDDDLEEADDPADSGPDIDSDGDKKPLPAQRALFEQPCVQCGTVIQWGDRISWANGPEHYGAHHRDCQSVNQERPAREGAPVSLDETPTMPEGDNESISRTLSALHPALQEIQAPTPWRSSLEVIAEKRQDTVWLVSGLIPAGAVVLLSGREGSMKTWVAMSLAHAVAAGIPWIGQPTTQGAVLYLDGELPRDVLQERLQEIGGVQDLNIWGWTDASFPQGLGDANLIQASRTHKLIIVDTLRRHMKNLKENSSDDMAQITGALKELTAGGAAVLVLHHAPKDPDQSGYRGSTELGAGVDITVSLAKKKTGNAERLLLHTHKTRYSFSEDFEIQVARGKRAPVFSMDNPTQDDGERALDALRAVIVELRQGSGKDPAQTEIIAEAYRRRLGATDKIRKRLEEGGGKYWRSVRTGNRRTYTVIVA